MIDPITSPVFKASPILSVVTGNGASDKTPASTDAFRSILADSIQQVQNTGDFASKTVEQFLSGDNQDLHTVAIASQRAELTFEFFLQARNKVVSAYQEVMRMQL
jgi:flagellar hook-basal body complex protein FliE